MDRITNAELNAAFARYMLALENAGVSVEHLVLIHGSKTYGNSYRVVYRDPKTGGQTDAPGNRTWGGLGSTKREAHDALHMAARVIEDVAWRKVMPWKPSE